MMVPSDLPFSEACERNKDIILEQLRQHLVGHHSVLEIGSGSGQHAVHFASHLPQITWYTSDRLDYHPAIHYRINHAQLANLMPPFHLDIGHTPLPAVACCGFFSANTAHIMQPQEVRLMMNWISERLQHGVFCQYGPFRFNGEFTSNSNRDFHDKLINSGRGGYRDITELQAWAPRLTLAEVIDLPANNHLLVWRRS